MVDGVDIDNSEESTGETEVDKGRNGVELKGFGIRWGSGSSNDRYHFLMMIGNNPIKY